jgi:hypothetical protein
MVPVAPVSDAIAVSENIPGLSAATTVQMIVATAAAAAAALTLGEMLFMGAPLLVVSGRGAPRAATPSRARCAAPDTPTAISLDVYLDRSGRL